MSDDAPAKGPDDSTLRPDAFRTVQMESVAEQLQTLDLDGAPFALVITDGAGGLEMNMFSLLQMETVEHILTDALKAVRDNIERQNHVESGRLS